MVGIAFIGLTFTFKVISSHKVFDKWSNSSLDSLGPQTQTNQTNQKQQHRQLGGQQGCKMYHKQSPPGFPEAQLSLNKTHFRYLLTQFRRNCKHKNMPGIAHLWQIQLGWRVLGCKGMQAPRAGGCYSVRNSMVVKGDQRTRWQIVFGRFLLLFFFLTHAFAPHEQ